MSNILDQFVGTWKQVAAENFEEYLKAVGHAPPSGGHKSEHTMSFSKVSDGKYHFKIVAHGTTHEHDFKIGEQFDTGKRKGIVKVEGNKFVQTMTNENGVQSSITGELVGGQLVCTHQTGNTKAVSKFEKA